MSIAIIKNYFEKGRTKMSKKITTLVVVLALMFSLATVATAAGTSTNGSIVYEQGQIIVIPGDCCDCFGKPAENGCECYCHEFDDIDDPDEFKDFDLGGNLYFGVWKVGKYGDFDSVNPGRLVGAQVINQTIGQASVRVSISNFVFGETTNTLDGATLTLKANDKAAGAGMDASTANQFDNVLLEPEAGAVKVLTVDPGYRVKANWTGVMNVLSGTAIYEGTAQAILTWDTVAGI